MARQVQSRGVPEPGWHPQRQAPPIDAVSVLYLPGPCGDTGGRYKDSPLHRREMEAKAQGHLWREGGKKGWRKPRREAAGRPQGGRVAAAREWEGRQDSLGQGDGPAFQELAQILTEATTLLCCPNHTSSFFLAARLPGAWQAPRFLGWNLGWGQSGWGLGGRR